MNAALNRLGRACARRRRLVIVAWLLVAAVLTLAARGAGERTTDDLTLPGTGSTKAAEALERELPDQAYGSNPIVLHGKLTDEAIEETAAKLREVPHVTGVGAPQRTQDTAALPVTLDVGPGDLTEEQAEAILHAAHPAGIEVSAGGYVGSALSKPSTHMSEVIGLAAAIVILLLALGSAFAMALPIATAVLGLMTTLALVTLLGHATDMPTIAPTLATMIGLGVGIDYALFVVTRHRQQLRAGMELHESIGAALATAGGAVLFAGGTVVIALASLAVAGIPLVTTLGYVSGLAVVVSVLAATTLLPALLGLLGTRIEAPSREERSPGWARWARNVAARPWQALLAGTAILVVLALPLKDFHLGQADVGKLPESTTARQAYDLMSEAFGPGSNGPLLVTGVDAIPQTPGIQSTTTTAPGLLTVIPTTAPSDRATEDLVNRLRDELPPGAYVGGQTAGYIDLATRISATLPLMVAIVCGLSVIVLLAAFRSLLIPLKAALMNLLSVAAAYGIVTFAFDPIVSFVPLLMFAILFGLSMDYEVFLLTEVREHHRRGAAPVHAVVEGLADTGRVITSAALIMVCVFTSFVLNGDPVVKQFGVGLAAAIAIDATIVRCLLVPAVMTLLGRWAWWLPRSVLKKSVSGGGR